MQHIFIIIDNLHKCKFQFVEQTKPASHLLRRAQLYALYQCIALLGRISKRASKHWMLVCLLLDKLFLKNPLAMGRLLLRLTEICSDRPFSSPAAARSLPAQPRLRPPRPPPWSATAAVPRRRRALRPQ